MALSANTERVTRGERRLKSFPVAADAVIYQGALVMVNSSGYLITAAAAAGNRYVGVATENIDATGLSAGDLWCVVEYDQIVYIPNSSADQSWVGTQVYATADDTISQTATDNTVMGIVVEYDETGVTSGKGEGVWVDTRRKQ